MPLFSSCHHPGPSCSICFAILCPLLLCVLPVHKRCTNLPLSSTLPHSSRLPSACLAVFVFSRLVMRSAMMRFSMALKGVLFVSLLFTAMHCVLLGEHASDKGCPLGAALQRGVWISFCNGHTPSPSDMPPDLQLGATSHCSNSNYREPFGPYPESDFTSCG